MPRMLRVYTSSRCVPQHRSATRAYGTENRGMTTSEHGMHDPETAVGGCRMRFKLEVMDLDHRGQR